jgi:hypothetical protein
MQGARLGFGLALALGLGVLQACLVPLEDPFAEEEGRSGAADGAECEADDDCKSGACLNHSRLCAPSYCTCPSADCPAGGQASSDCSDNAVCVYYEDIFESVGEVFMVEHDMNGGHCRPLCEKGCPDHFTCGSDGRFCQADSSWNYPIATIGWSGQVTGTFSGRLQTHSEMVEYDKPIALMASGSSPLGKELRFEWTINDSRMDRMSSATSEQIVVESGQNSARAELHAIDDEGRSGIVTVIFQGCTGAGQACGYEGSGCCNGCDRDANTCM